MRIELTDDKKFLALKDLKEKEVEQIKSAFTEERPNAWIIKQKCAWAVTTVEFFNRYGLLPAGLWKELINVCRTYGFNAEFSPEVNDLIQDVSVTEEYFNSYIADLFAKSDKKMKEYQVKGIFMLAHFRKCCAEVTTSGGKTLMSYALYRYMRDEKHVSKCLYIVPNKNLVTQTYDKFNQYEDWVHGKHEWKGGMLMSGLTKKERSLLDNADIVFGTYQSLIQKDAEYMQQFDAIICDECHHAKTHSLKKIITECGELQYCFGLTGTFPKDNYSKYTIESYIGPVVYELTAYQLINDENFATPIYIVNELLDYATDKEKKAMYEQRISKPKGDVHAGNKLLDDERTFMHNSLTRLKYVATLATKTKHNTLILFNDVKLGRGYGKKIYDYLKDNTTKHVYYADGGTDNNTRNYYEEQMEADDEGRTVFVGSTGCFSEGIDIANLWTIILVDSVKSEYIVRQFIGRGMRRYEGKDKVVIFDIVDDYRFGNASTPKWLKENYLYKHHKERDRIYKEQKFPVFDQKVSFKDTDSLFTTKKEDVAELDKLMQ